jgi:hypothetical protein
LKAWLIVAITLVLFALGLSMGWHKVMAQVPAPTQTTSLSPALAATVSEAKPTPKDTAPDNSKLDRLLRQEGFGVVKLKRENLDNQKAHKNNPKHLILDAEVNRASASLWVDELPFGRTSGYHYVAAAVRHAKAYSGCTRQSFAFTMKRAT